jgi:hypothetical protein
VKHRTNLLPQDVGCRACDGIGVYSDGTSCPICERLAELLRRDWSVRVLDAWAQANADLRPFQTGREPTEAERWCCWRVQSPGEVLAQVYFYGPTSDAARLAAADAVWRELSKAAQARIGARP